MPEHKKEPKYTTPQTVPLGEMAKGQGQEPACRPVGSGATQDCSTGNAALACTATGNAAEIGE